MSKIKVTKELKEEFKKTEYGKNYHSKLITYFIILVISSFTGGFILGFQESGNMLFEHENIVVIIAVVLDIFAAEQIGKIEGAIEYFGFSKKGKKK